MYLELPEGAVETEVSDKLQKLIPPNYEIEGCVLKDGVHCISIIKIRSVTAKINEADYLMTNEDIKLKIIDPMLRNLNRI